MDPTIDSLPNKWGGEGSEALIAGVSSRKVSYHHTVYPCLKAGVFYHILHLLP